MAQEIIGQIFGIATTVLSAISYQANTKKKLLILSSLAISCICISYLLLGAYSGFALNVICLIRNICFYFIKENTKTHRIVTALLVVTICIVGALSWQGPISLLIIIALAINTYFISLGKPQLLRYSLLLTCTMVLIYDIVYFSIGGIANESISAVSAVIGIIRYFKLKRSGALTD
jgi:hypothetical protein